MQIAIICGGLATRLGELSKTIPKSMILVAGKPFLEYQIENIKRHGIKDIVLCVGHLSEKIQSYFKDGSEFGVNIKYSYDGDKLLGPIGAIKNAEKMLKDEFFIMYGDSYISVDFQKVFSYYKENKKLALMVVFQNKDKYDKSNLKVNNNLVISHGEKDADYIDYGTSILNKKTLDFLEEDKFYSTGDFFKILIRKQELLAYEAKRRFYHIGNPEALEEIREHIKEKCKC